MTAIKTLSLCALLALCCSALHAIPTPAPPEIDLESPVGTPLASGGTIDLGDNPDRNQQSTTIRIRNSGGSDLTLTGTAGNYLQPSGAVQVDYTIGQPGSPTITAGNFIDLTILTTPNAKGDWQLVITIPNDDADEGSYVFSLKGKAGKKDDDDDCSTHEGSTGGLLVLMGILSAAVVGLRLRGARD